MSAQEYRFEVKLKGKLFYELVTDLAHCHRLAEVYEMYLKMNEIPNELYTISITDLRTGKTI